VKYAVCVSLAYSVVLDARNEEEAEAIARDSVSPLDTPFPPTRGNPKWSEEVVIVVDPLLPGEC